MRSMCVMASSQSDANADGAIIVSIEPTQLTIVEKLKPLTKSDLAYVSIDLYQHMLLC